MAVMCSRAGFITVVILAASRFISGQIVPQTSVLDGYTALVPVNIRCINNPDVGLTCNAEYPDQCKEQWNFPNPCTQINLSVNKTKFVHPFDKTKFLMCGELGKLYVVQCPQYEVYHEGCGQCVGESAGLTASCETPLTQMVTNPCSREAILANKLFFPFPRNISKFIHCDIWGKAWERICTPGEVWNQFDVACVNPILLNPCIRRTVKDANTPFPHPCDPFKYLMCDTNGDALEVICDQNYAFSESTQRCEPIQTFGGILENICQNFQFGFKFYSGPKPGLVLPTPPSVGQGVGVSIDSTNTLVSGPLNTGTRPQTGINGNAGGVGIRPNRLNEILNMWKQNVASSGTGVSRFSDATNVLKTGPQPPTAGNQVPKQAPAGSIHPSQLKEYTWSDVPYREPCTVDNLSNRRTHFRLKGDPHSFLQCDNAGRMYKMPCSTNKKDWFDVYTMTCVDGPVHVEHRKIAHG